MKVIYSAQAPEAIGPYSQAIKVGNTVYLAGQIPLEPNTMKVCSDKIDLQIEQVFFNLAQVCKEAGGSLAQIVKLSIYLTDLSHSPLVNEIMMRYFSPPYPARLMLEVAALPKEVKIEIDGMMVIAAAD